MAKDGLVQAVIETCLNFLHVDQFSVDNDPTKPLKSKTFVRAQNTHWRSLVEDVLLSLLKYEMVFFKKGETKIFAGDDDANVHAAAQDGYANADVPFVLPMPLVTFDPIYDENGNKVLQNIRYNGQLDPDVKYFVTKNRGPDVFSGAFISKCGSILKHYESLLDLSKDEESIRKKNMEPVVYLERIPPSEQTVNLQAVEEYQNMISQKYDQFGYVIVEAPKIHIKDRTGILPTMYRMCNYQPPLPADITSTEKYEQFITLLVSVFNVPRMFIDDREMHGRNTNTQAKITAEVKRLRIALTKLVENVKIVIQKMFEMLYKVPEADIFLPIKTTIDMETIDWLFRRRYIDGKMAAVEMSAATGLETMEPQLNHSDTEDDDDKPKRIVHDDDDDGNMLSKRTKRGVHAKRGEGEDRPEKETKRVRDD